MKIPSDLLYTKEHEWIKVDGNKAYIGITDYAQHSLGDIVYVDLPSVDDDLSSGESFGAVESVKAASDVYMPISGTILEVNTELEDNPGLINEDAYANWLIIVEIKDESELEELLSSINYSKICD